VLTEKTNLLLVRRNRNDLLRLCIAAGLNWELGSIEKNLEIFISDIDGQNALAAFLQDIDAEHAHVHAVKHGKTLALENGFVPPVRHSGVDNDTDQAPARLRK
jgi:hypothetical protein